MRRGRAQDIIRARFFGPESLGCLPPRFNCRIHHSAAGLCFGLQREGDVWSAVDVVHTKLGACAVAALLPRAHALWLRGLPPGRGDAVARAAAVAGPRPARGLPCPASPGAPPGPFAGAGGGGVGASRGGGAPFALAVSLAVLAMVLLIALQAPVE